MIKVQQENIRIIRIRDIENNDNNKGVAREYENKQGKG